MGADAATADGGEELGYLHVHAVGQPLVAGDTFHCGVHLLGVAHRPQFGQQSVHPQHLLREELQLFLGTLQVEFGGAYGAAADVGEAVVVGFVVCPLLRHHAGDNPHYLRYEPRLHANIHHVEHCMEKRQRHRAVAGDDCLHHRKNGTEKDERQCDTDDIEDQMCPGGTFASNTSHGGGDVGRDCGANVLAHDQCNSNIKLYPSVVEHQQCDGHCG